MSESSSDNRFLSSPDFLKMSQGKVLGCNKECKTNEVQNRKKRKSLPKAATEHLKRWLLANKDNPYPPESVKIMIAKQFNLTVTQVNNWFINNRRRLFKKLFPEHNHKPVYRLKRGAGKSVKRPKLPAPCDDNTGSSVEDLTPPRKMRRTNPVVEDDLSPVEFSDSESSRDKLEYKARNLSFNYTDIYARYEWCNFLTLIRACEKLQRESLNVSRVLFC